MQIRKYLPEDKYVVIHDGFDLTAWKDFMREDHFTGVVLDTHQYLMVAESQGCEQTLEGYVDLLGSDSHGIHFRPLHFDRVRAWIEKEMSSEMRETIFHRNFDRIIGKKEREK